MVDAKIIEKTKSEVPRIIDLGKNIEFIFMAGSLIEGFGNENSDIDLFVIVNKMPQIKEDLNKAELVVNDLQENVIVHNIVIEGIRYDIEYHEISKVNHILEKLNSYKYKYNEFNTGFTEDEFDFLHRFKNSIPVMNEQIYSVFYNKLLFNNLNYYKASIHIDGFDGLLEDALGAFESKDYGSSYFMSKLLINNALNGILAIKGETNPGNKWLYRKLKKYCEDIKDNSLMDYFIELENFQYIENIHEEEYKNYLKKAVKFSKNLNHETQKILNDYMTLKGEN